MYFGFEMWLYIIMGKSELMRVLGMLIGMQILLGIIYQGSI